MVQYPIQRSLVPERHPAYYMMHKYWARKPHNVVRTYIEHYTLPGELVLDPFSGSGVTAIESLLLGRKAIAVDINPMACLITEATVADIDVQELSAAFHLIKKQVVPYVKQLYRTTCPNCTSNALVTHAVWERIADCPYCGQVIGLASVEKIRGKFCCSNCGHASRITSRTIREEQMREIWYLCTHCKNSGKKESSQEDEFLAKKGFGNGSPNGIRNAKMFLSNRTLIYEDMTVASFFTVRNYQILSLIVQAIQKIPGVAVKHLLEFVFTSSVAQASRLIPYRSGLTSGGPAWTVSGFWIPNLHFELNAWNCFENRFKKVLKGKGQIDEQFNVKGLRRKIAFGQLQTDYDLAILNRSCTELKNFISSNSVDYIFTDPPYGDSVPYLEYSTIWSSWLGHEADYDNEIVVSDSHERNKDIQNYRHLMSKALQECYRVLKDGKWLSLTFHNRDMEVWDAIIGAASNAGFELVNCLYQVPAVISAKAQLSRTGSTTGDIILNFRKPEAGIIHQPILVEQTLEEIVIAESEQIIGERGGIASTDEILRGVIIQLIKLHISSVPRQNILQILQSHFIGENGVWKFRPDQMEKINKYESIEARITDIVEKCIDQGIHSFKEVLAEVLSELREGRTPNVKLVMNIYQKTTEEYKQPRQLALF
jgi:DNA modification methylase